MNLNQGIEYKDGKLEAVYGPEGRLTAVYDQYGVSLTHYRAEYWLRDHLGNTRLAFSDENHDGAIDTYDNPNTPENESEIVQAKRSGVPYRRKEVGKNHYYPFGMNHEGPWYGGIGPENKYQYNGKELNEDFGLNWYDFGARWQDPATGRWWQVDPLARNYAPYSPYQYTLNNPIRFIDPDGRMVMSHDDYVYLNTKGEEIGRIKDDKVQQVIIIADENLKKFDDLPYGKESIDDAANLGNTYDMKGVLAMYNRSAKDILPPVVDGTTYIDDGTGKPRYDVAAEHGNYLVKGNDGIVKVSSAPDIQGSHVGVILDKPSGNKLGTIHTHPNEDKKGIIRSTQTGAVIDPRYKGPSDTDLKQYPPRRGFHNIVVDNKHVYFYKGDQTTKVIKISKSKL